ncbi:MAG: hypothetical protein KDA91_09095 [Planctomycetaceae bacterium]|nr:hypothetical protein [Planctomycetaceae bacterium]
MLHNIITILTTTAVALHAMLGCCAHHEHSCNSHALGSEAVAVVESESHCPCHHHHDDDSTTPDENSDKHDGHQHNGPHEDCDEPDCSFVSVQPNDDVGLTLSFSMWLPALGDAASVESLDALVTLQAYAEGPPLATYRSGDLRAQSQVWRL